MESVDSDAQPDIFLVIYSLQLALKGPESDSGTGSWWIFGDIATSGPPVWAGSLSTPLRIPKRSSKNFKPGSITHYNLSENKKKSNQTVTQVRYSSSHQPLKPSFAV